MSLTTELCDELNVLLMFDLSSTQTGIKVHSDAAPNVIAAASRLFDKGLLTQADGGYLTSLGFEAAEQLQSAVQILTSD